MRRLERPVIELRRTMVDVSRSGAVRSRISGGVTFSKVPTASPAPLIISICRIFLRLVLLGVIDRHGMVTDRSHKYRPLIDRVEMRWFAGLLPNI